MRMRLSFGTPVVPAATIAFCYNLFRKEGKTHELADILGFETGKAIAQIHLKEPID